jgi:Peptidase family S41/Tricorn protease C1 domain
MTTKHIIIAFSALVFFSSCEKLLVEPTPSNAPTAIFEETWKAIDQNYSFLEYKKLNWDSIGTVYRKKVNDNISDDSLFNVLNNMLYTLKDGHVNLKTPFNRSRNWEWYLGYAQNYDEGLLERNYLGKWKVTGNLTHSRIRNVGYFHYASFSNAISTYDLDYIMDEYKNAKGLIIDIRDNGGGSISNAFKILNRLTDKSLLVGKEIAKKGTAHNDFDVAKEVWLNPTADSKKFLGKVIILTNRSCYSAASHFVAYARALPNVTIVGDQTGGGGGLPTGLELSNGWALRYSATIGTDAKGFNFENGTPPNIKIDMSKADIDKGKDSILERALAEF